MKHTLLMLSDLWEVRLGCLGSTVIVGLLLILMDANTDGCQADAQALYDDDSTDDDDSAVLWPLVEQIMTADPSSPPTLPLPTEKTVAKSVEVQSPAQVQVQIQAEVHEMIQAKVHEMVDAADSLLILDAYLTDKEAVENGTAPEGFEMPPLDYYKQAEITVPLTKQQQDDLTQGDE